MSKAADNYKDQGNEEFKKGNYEKAIEFYTYATEMDPRNHIYYTNRAMCYAAMKKWDKSLRDAEKSLTFNKDWVKGHYRRGLALQNLGNLEDAVKEFQICMQLEPKTEDFKKAYELAKRELYKGLSEPEILKLEANDDFKKGKIDEALAKYTRALGMIPEGEKNPKMLAVKADLHANRAACNVQLYEPKKVREDCDAALRIDPNHVKALLRRGQALESLEKYKLALDDFEHAIRLEPNCKMALDATGRIRNALKKLGQL